MTKHEPCPFCGEEVEGLPALPKLSKNGDLMLVHTCKGFSMFAVRPEYWDNRPIEDALRKRIAELEQMRGDS